MKLFDTRRISKMDLTRQLEQGDREAGTTERNTSWDGEILKVDWGSSPKQEAKPTMSITGLQSGAFQAKLAEMKQRMVEKQNSALSRVDAATVAGHAKIDEAISGVEAKISKEIEDSLQEFAQFTNGGPA